MNKNKTIHSSHIQHTYLYVRWNFKKLFVKITSTMFYLDLWTFWRFGIWRNRSSTVFFTLFPKTVNNNNLNVDTFLSSYSTMTTKILTKPAYLTWIFNGRYKIFFRQFVQFYLLFKDNFYADREINFESKYESVSKIIGHMQNSLTWWCYQLFFNKRTGLSLFNYILASSIILIFI